jgi:HEAT repeat protein
MLWWVLHQLKSSKPDIRAKAAKRLGSEKQRKAVPSLIKRLKDDSSHVRIAVVDALGAIGHPVSAEPLASALADLSKTAKSGSGHPGCDTGITEYESFAKALSALGPPAVKPMIRLLESDDQESRRWAACALGMIKDPQGVDPLIAVLKDSRSGVRKAAALALGQIGDSRALISLEQALTSKDSETRRAAAEALGDIGSEDAVDSLMKAVEDHNEPVQLSAISALKRIGGLKSAGCLRSASAGPRKAVCEAAESALKSLKFSPGNAEERAEIAVILGDFAAAVREGTTAVPALIKSLGFKDPQMRRKTAEALGLLGTAEAVQPLLQALKDHNPEVQQAAMQALVTIGYPALEGLKACLTYYDASVVRLAAIALGQIGDVRSVPALVETIAANRNISPEYSEMLDAILAATDALRALLNAYSETIRSEDLERIAELPEEILLRGSQPPRYVDCTFLRNHAREEILRRLEIR